VKLLDLSILHEPSIMDVSLETSRNGGNIVKTRLRKWWRYAPRAVEAFTRCHPRFLWTINFTTRYQLRAALEMDAPSVNTYNA
jgi:hypothetical protein